MRECGIPEVRPLEAEDPPSVGRYRIVGRLGAGGMGRVYLARSPAGRAVAVKVVRPELAEDTAFRRRFAREVSAARRVSGAFTADVLDAGTDATPPWLATVYVPGPSLDEAVTEHGPWPEKPVLRLGAGLAEALTAVHAAGLVHRDLKPSNVLIAPDGPRVIDFGISLAVEASALTTTGAVMGTPGYMSPEQLTGRPVEPASDVFSLASVLVFAATGTGPFGTGAGAALGFRAVYEEPALDGLPPVLRETVEPCLAKEPASRPTVGTLLERLTDAAGPGTGDRPSARLGEAPGPPRVDRGEPPRPSAAEADAVRDRVPPPADRPPAASPGRGPAPSPRPPGGRPTRRALLAFGGLTAAAAGAGFWRMAGGGGRGREPQERPVRWKRDSASAFVPADRYLYVAGDTGSVQQLSAGSGTRLFDRDTELSPRGLAHHGFTLYVVGATDGEESAVVSVDTLGVADDWRFTTETEVSTVVRAGDTVYATGEGVVHALDDRGKHLWTHRTPWGHDDEVGQAGAYPAVRVVAGTVYATGRNRLYALHASSGEPRWEYRAAERAAAGPTTAPVVAAGVVYQAGGRVVHAVDARSGTAKWRFVTRGGAVCEPQVRDGMLYAGAGSLHALDTATGTERWRFTPSAGALTSFSAVGGGTAIAVCDDLLVAVDSRTGEERWRFTRPTPDAGPLSAPVAAQGRVYTVARSRPHLYGLDASTGDHLWTADLRDVQEEEVPGGTGPPVVSAGTVHVIAGGALHAVEA